MKASRKLLSLPIISLHEGQHLGHVRGLVLDASAKALAALIVDPKGFFKDQRVIPYNKVVSVGDDAITIDKGSQVEKVTSIPELLELLKEKVSIIGTKIVTETGKTIGIAEEYFIDTASGKITNIEVSGGKMEGLLNGKALLEAEQVKTIGHDVIVTVKNSENHLVPSEKGLSDTVRNLLHATGHKASDTTQTLSSYFKKGNHKGQETEQNQHFSSDSPLSEPEEFAGSKIEFSSTNEDPPAPCTQPDCTDGNSIKQTACLPKDPHEYE